VLVWRLSRKWAELCARKNNNKTRRRKAAGYSWNSWKNLDINIDNQQVVYEMWTRPVLCRICECPLSDGGVQVDELDAAKLSKWWLCKIGTDFQPDESEIEEIICNFCIWDAR
jgi:hypothetical protein